jgi:hypothetical protein
MRLLDTLSKVSVFGKFIFENEFSVIFRNFQLPTILILMAEFWKILFFILGIFLYFLERFVSFAVEYI